jgi:hypothetical protein
LNNGGPTLTHLPLDDNPAIDAIPLDDCLVVDDQRGMIRPQQEKFDIGALEIGGMIFVYLPAAYLRNTP